MGPKASAAVARCAPSVARPGVLGFAGFKGLGFRV